MKKMILTLGIMFLMGGLAYAEEVCFQHPTKATAVVCCQPTQAITANGVVTGCPVQPFNQGLTLVQIDQSIYQAKQNINTLTARKVKAQAALNH